MRRIPPRENLNYRIASPPIDCICPQCKRPHKKLVELAYLDSPYVWCRDGRPIILCNNCKGEQNIVKTCETARKTEQFEGCLTLNTTEMPDSDVASREVRDYTQQYRSLKVKYCSKCDEARISGQYCFKCGTELTELLKCKCGKELHPVDDYCPDCGTKVMRAKGQNTGEQVRKQP